ncbi:MAG: hypothetical protein PHX49_06710 [Bacteroidales bacterium]|nr:hypothetical protein [Bacteroidales bacterium]
MERKIYLIVVWGVLCSLASAVASPKSDIYQAYVSNNMTLWKKTIDRMNLQNPKSDELRIELLNYQYGYIGWCMGKKRHKEAESYIELGQKSLQILEKRGTYASMVQAYKSAFYGFHIGINLLKAPFIGPKSVACAQLAMKEDPQNPYGFIQYANAQFYMPSVFGGSKKSALAYYRKAELLMESDRTKGMGDWNYLSLLAMIAKTYVELKDIDRAKGYYEKILHIEPDFLWVKNELYPSVVGK